MTEQRYTFSSADNSYFNGRDVRVTDTKTGASILVNVKDRFWAIDVKDADTFHSWPSDVKTAAEKIGDAETENLYNRVQESYWQWARTDLAWRSGFSTVYSAGRSGGWLAVEDTQNWDPESMLNPGEEEHEDVGRFLALAFEAVAAIDAYRQQFYDDVKAAALVPPRVKIMVLADGGTFGPLEGCKIVEVSADLSTEEIESLLADDPGLTIVQTWKDV